MAAAAHRIVASKAFDNSILCTNESVLIVEEKAVTALEAALRREGAYILGGEETAAVKGVIFDGDRFNTAWVGKSAQQIADAAGIKVPAKTRVMVAPFPLVVPEEMLAHEKLCPVLGMVVVPSAARGIDAARAVLRISGAGHSAAIHSEDSATIMAFASAVPVLRVAVNVGNSLGSSGIETNLAPTMTIGTGFFGRSSVGENLEPKHLVNMTRIAYPSDGSSPMGDFNALQPWHAPAGAVPPYPIPSNAEGAPALVRADDPQDDLRDEIRRLVVEELREILRG